MMSLLTNQKAGNASYEYASGGHDSDLSINFLLPWASREISRCFDTAYNMVGEGDGGRILPQTLHSFYRNMASFIALLTYMR